MVETAVFAEFYRGVPFTLITAEGGRLVVWEIYYYRKAKELVRSRLGDAPPHGPIVCPASDFKRPPRRGGAPSDIEFWALPGVRVTLEDTRRRPARLNYTHPPAWPPRRLLGIPVLET